MFRYQRRFWKIPNPNVIESDEGFSVRVLGRTGLRYTQGDKTLFVDSEILATRNPSMIISPSSIQHWDPPYDEESIDEVTRKLIVENILRAFASKGEKITVPDIYETIHDTQLSRWQKFILRLLCGKPRNPEKHDRIE